MLCFTCIVTSQIFVNVWMKWSITLRSVFFREGKERHLWGAFNFNQCILNFTDREICFISFQHLKGLTWCQVSTHWKHYTINWQWGSWTTFWNGPPIASLWPPFPHPHTVTLHWLHHSYLSHEHSEVLWHCNCWLDSDCNMFLSNVGT